MCHRLLQGRKAQAGLPCPPLASLGSRTRRPGAQTASELFEVGFYKPTETDQPVAVADGFFICLTDNRRVWCPALYSSTALGFVFLIVLQKGRGSICIYGGGALFS